MRAGPMFIHVRQGVVARVEYSLPPGGSALCSKGILELSMVIHPYFSYIFVLSKLVVPILGPRQYKSILLLLLLVVPHPIFLLSGHTALLHEGSPRKTASRYTETLCRPRTVLDSTF